MLEFVAKTPADQETSDIWANLDPSANLADFVCAFEDGDGMAGFRKTVGSGETAETTADNDNVDGK